MPELRTRVDVRAAGSAVANETHVVGEDTANSVFLDEEPDEAQAITVTGPGGAPSYLKVAGAPAAGEFRHVSGTSELQFHASDDGDSIEVDYTRLGSEVRARDLNRIHQKLQGVRVITDAATVTLDFGDEWANRVTLGGNRTIEVGTFPPAGAFVVLETLQDGTGTRVPTWDAGDFDFGTDGAPTLTTTASKRDILTFYSIGTKLLFTGMKGGYA